MKALPVAHSHRDDLGPVDIAAHLRRRHGSTRAGLAAVHLRREQLRRAHAAMHRSAGDSLPHRRIYGA